MNRSVALFLVLVTWLGAPRLGVAEESENKTTPWKRAGLNLGGFFAALNSSVSIGAAGVGVDVDVEDALDFDTTTTAFRTDAYWRFTRNKRHRVDFTWFSLRRSGRTTLGRDLEFGDTVFPLGSTVKSSFDFDIYKGGYSYSFLQDDRVDLAASVGLYIAPISFDITATGAFTGQDESDVTAPLPVVGLRADFAITPKWFLRTSAEAFYLEIDNYKGAIVDFQAAVEYAAFKHVGFGLGFDILHVSVEANASNKVIDLDFGGEVNFDYAGIQFYMKFYL